jgi:hypothetical protein
MFTDGCMKLHRAGKITNARKGQYDGVSVTTFAFGSPELYAWLDGNTDVAFLPVEIVNSPEVIGANDDMISINGALATDIHGQVVADAINGNQFSGIGGAEDFVAGAGLELSDRSLICLPSTFSKDGELAVADRAVVRPRRGDHHAAPPGRRDRHRVRRRRTRGQDRAGARRGACGGRAPSVPRRTVGGSRSGVEGPLARRPPGDSPPSDSRTRAQRGVVCANHAVRESMTDCAARSPASTAPSM